MKKVLSKFKLEKFEQFDIPKVENIKREREFNKVLFQNFEWVKLEDSIGRISANEIGLYPPGTPIVIRGEVIDENLLKTLLKYKNYLFGVDSERVCVLK